MLKFTLRAGVLILTTTVAIPYAIAFIANLTHGWPIEKKKFRRAFHPRKVYSLNLAIFKQLGLIRLLPLYIRWKRFYAAAQDDRIFKDILYGESQCRLDVYRPENAPNAGALPVVVFVYGGTWSSGDKNMYPLLCSQLADNLQAVVCCPNYSLYPKGYVDDMVRDIVDMLKWIHSDVQYFGGDKERIMLIGHSAGAHLISLAVLELAMKQLLEDPASMVTSLVDDVTPSMSVSRQASGIHFDDVHFNSSNGAQQFAEATAKTTAPLTAENNGENNDSNQLQVSGKGSLKLESSGGSSFLFVGSDPQLQQRSNFGRNESDDSSFLMLEGSGGKLALSGDSVTGSGLVGNNGGNGLSRADSENGAPLQFEAELGQDAGDVVVATGEEVKEEEDENITEEQGSDDDKTVEEITPGRQDETQSEEMLEQEVLDTLAAGGGIEGMGDRQVSLGFEVSESEDQMTRSQREASSVLTSVKVVLGLAGVYHIGDHYEFEYSRGVEDISTMARTMYGKESFERFSPTAIVQSLPKGTRLPAFHLVHGSKDATVPIESSNKFSAALSHMGARHVSLVEIPDCGHKDLCLDLMDDKRKYYTSVMSQVLGIYQKFLS